MSQVVNKVAGYTVASALVLAAAGQAQAIGFTASGTTVDLYGYARLNAAYDLDEDVASEFGAQAGSFDEVNAGDAEDDEVSGHFGADAVQSRLGVDVAHESGVHVKVEGDFRPGNLRIRQAYGEYRGILAGQTWSNFNSFVGFTSALDFDALAGSAGLQNRTAQLRYTTGDFSVSLEEPNSSILDIGASSVAEANEKTGLPALTARYESSAGPLDYSVAGLVKTVETDDGGSVDDSATGGAVFSAVTYHVTSMISLQGVLTYSDGANSYLYRSGDDFGAADAYYANGSLETISGYGGTVGASFQTGNGSFNVGYGMVTNDWDDAEDDGLAVGNEHETNSNIIVNYQWTPVENVMYGVEYHRLMVEEVDGDEGDANRVMFAAQYSF